MQKGWRWALVLSLLPAIIGGLVWLVYFRLKWLPDYIVYSRISLGILVFWTGSVISIVLIGSLAVAWALANRGEQKAKRDRIEAIAAHRQFIFRLDHELKNPLTSLQVELANLEATIDSSGENSGEQALTLQRLKEQTSRLRELVLQLRKLAELENQSIEPGEVNLDQLLTELVNDIKANSVGMAREITLNLPQVPWPLPKVRGDSDLLYLALHNVLENAVKFTQPGDSIQIRAYEDSNRVVVEFADTGPGIPEDEQPHVWEELFRGKMARGMPGSGLGLALVKVIVERHAGQVSIRSRVHWGTVITIRLPAQM